jgi:hypothetical protein
VKIYLAYTGGNAMIEHNPHQVILEELRSYEQSPSDLLAVVRDHDELNRFIRPIKYKLGLPHGAKTATVHFLKERSIPDYQVHAIAFEDTAGLWWRLFCLVVQDPAGNWFVGGCSGTAGNDAIRRPPSRYPKLILSGDSNDHFYAGGSVIDDTRLGIARVRLLSNGELMAEDTVQDDLVVFVSDQSVQMPIRSEFYNQAGEYVGAQQVSFVL